MNPLRKSFGQVGRALAWKGQGGGCSLERRRLARLFQPLFERTDEFAENFRLGSARLRGIAGEDVRFGLRQSNIERCQGIISLRRTAGSVTLADRLVKCG